MNLVNIVIKFQVKIDFSYLKFALNISKAYSGFGNFGAIEKNNEEMVNIFQAKKTKFISYNNSIVEMDNFQEINEKEIEKSNDKKFVWDLYFLNKKRNADNE